MRACDQDLFHRERGEGGGGVFECIFKPDHKNGN